MGAGHGCRARGCAGRGYRAPRLPSAGSAQIAKSAPVRGNYRLPHHLISRAGALQLADKVRPTIASSGEEDKPEHRTHLTILSAVAWIAGAALAIPSGGVSLYAGVVTLNAIAAVSGAAASLLPAGTAKSLSADTVDGVLEKMSEVMALARSDLAEREKDITSALQHNLEALASFRR